VKLYPNPVAGMLNIEINSPVTQDANIAIMSANGTLVKSMTKELQAGEMILTENTSELAPGIYYLLITRDDQRIIKRFVVLQ
jgi:phage repressor protein C with HTH and peptisase S24 domain